MKDFRGFGGVRLEDDVWITADGCENLTLCPRAVEEVLDVMHGGDWPRKFAHLHFLSGHKNVLTHSLLSFASQPNWISCLNSKGHGQFVKVGRWKEF